MRVLDLTQLTAAYATRVMAEAGATVLRIESPAARELPVAADPLHAYFNAGKLGLTLDPASPAGRQLLDRLLDTCDAVVEGQAAHFWTAAGRGPDELARERPRLVVTSIEDERGESERGEGEAAGDEATDLDPASAELLLYAESGLLSITGEPDGRPVLVGGHAALAMAGLQAAIGTYAALIWQRHSGRGQRVRVRPVDALRRFMEQPLVRWMIRGELTRRAGARGGATAINGAFRCRDGFVSLSVSADRASWAGFLRALEPSGLAATLTDPALAEEHERWRQRPQIMDVLERWARQYTRAELVETFLEHSLPAAPVLTIEDLTHDPQLEARGFLRRAAVDPGGRESGPLVPAGAVATALGRAAALGPAPAPGQDNATVYAALGYDREMQAALAASGAI